ncbi:hypothetical protein TRVL_01596 [Trypanosoma vivax]|nr:hypothetical protein TRVL_01596 [Trypanosoma vivax]
MIWCGLTRGIHQTQQHHNARMGTTHLTPLRTPIRGIVQSAGGTGLRSPLHQYEDFKLIRKLRRNSGGNYYRFQQKLWPSFEALEKDLTERLYSSTERTPIALLPRPKSSASPARVCVLEGRGSTALLDSVQSSVQNNTTYSDTDEYSSQISTQGESAGTVEETPADMAHENQAINSKILTEDDLGGTVLESARERARSIILEDLCVNELVPSPAPLAVTATVTMKHTVPSACDAGGVAWEGLGLCPVLSRQVVMCYGAKPTRLQTRLIPALLHEDHNDVVFNGVTGSGKTSALLLALLQAVRNESAGLNVFVASNAMTAMRAYDQLKALCGQLGGALVDRPRDDWSWMYMGTFEEEFEIYYRSLRRSLHSNHGPVRIFITTAETMCQLLFEKKMEFEAFGYLRRVYVDDVGLQIPMLPPDAPVEDARERLRNPLACELLLGTLHQLPGPHIRSVLQLGLVSADVGTPLKDHLKALCLKLERHVIVLSSVRVPSTIHCLFSFHLPHDDVYEYLRTLVWNARETIPGRALIYVRYEDDLLHVRLKLRRLGMDVKLFSEVYYNGEFRDCWKFLLLRESEAFGIHLPLVSHVFITFCPRTACSFQHMCGRTGRLGNVGWVYTIADKREAKFLREVATQLEVEFCNHVVDVNLEQVSYTDVDRQTKEFDLYGLDPQYAVKQHYIVQTENPDMAYRSREFFSKPVKKQFLMEDYTPTPVLYRRFVNARKLATDLNRDPSLVLNLQKQGLLDSRLRPTKRIKHLLDRKSRKYHAPVYSGSWRR